MRIIGGQWRGRALTPVGKGDASAHLRPTTDRTRESLFNMLEGGRYGDPITDARVLDLFAGTGALGLEALSRGAAAATFIENGRIAQALTRKNIALCGADTARLKSLDAARLPANPDAPYDLVFLDPPYGQWLGNLAMPIALQGGWLADKALVVWEDEAEPTPVAGLKRLDSRRYGDTVVTILEAEGS